MADAEGHQDPEDREELRSSSSDITPLRSFCWGVLHAIGMFAVEDLTSDERLNYADEKTWFSLGEVVMAGTLAATIATPAGFWFATRTDPALAFIGAAVLYLPLFVFLPKILRQAMKADTNATLCAFGKNEQVKKIFWTLFITLAGLVLTQIADPAFVQNIPGMLTGMAP